MKISQLLKEKQLTLSFEVFPPKTSEKFEATAANARKIAALHPDFMSVTYGAGGGTGLFTAEIASEIQEGFGVPTLAHLTCVSSTREHVSKMLSLYKEKNIENILALRGDLPQDGLRSADYRYAVQLIRDIKEREKDFFCLGGACYPEGHVECAHREEDLQHLKEKVDAGLDFLTTQLFFDNSIFYNFLYRAREKGITVPILAGIMPITRAEQLKRSVAMSGTEVPQRFRAIVDRFGGKETLRGELPWGKPEREEPRMRACDLELNFREVYRYLGCKGELPQGAVVEEVKSCVEELVRQSELREVHRRFSLQFLGEDRFLVGDMELKSRALSRNLRGCEEVYLMAATIGFAMDHLVARASAIGKMSRAVMMQASGAMLIESYCDALNKQLKEEAATEGKFLRPRFSPGYGDLPLSAQPDFFRILEVQKHTGITLSESLIMMPSKSVTALIGVSTEDAHCVLEGCESCAKTNCSFRR